MSDLNQFKSYLPLVARGYLIDLLGLCTDAQTNQHELREVLLYLNNLITYDEMQLQQED
ncbi:hypothetical protein [Vibrio gazogenes]|uniref:Uncharacterized protein n=1 Tax=Vibrio gazogenes DSM 21264 = NBRC 103151 TaxID=1123492 RepID=A0A1M5GRK7_VIBGA|nr:hypothetical protein [Vibrio gazogenes]USP13769.1 hypothetical protein MKS89_15620 [Vibrio gazogenes]SHG06384.1 hypothetical protein SAMN02745781_03884 [Vibrio gazogenes DSM 21264] [Vibrio gazogenes DSM 21264 = NBRC 103151]SJN53288.1 hypothetical protein BQ6471_00366 [Vibrio gazogenes]